MDTNTPDIAAIAKGLTGAQRLWLMQRPTDTDWTAWLPSSERREYRGLIRRTNCYANTLTSLGLSVRAYLMEADRG